MMEVTPFTPMKLLRHRHAVEAMLRGEVTYPISVELDLSNTCPHDCPFCSFGTSASQGYRQQTWVQFPLPRVIRLLEELAEVGTRSVTFTGGGEPLVHRHIAAILEQATAVGLQWGVVSNGVGLVGAARRLIAQHATFLRVSLDAGSSETHQVTHGVAVPQFHLILDHLRATRVLAGPRLTIGASFCVMAQNWKEIYAAAKQVKDAGANYLEVRPTYPTDWRGDGWGIALTPEESAAAQVELQHAQAHLDGDGFRVIGMVDRFASLHAPEKAYTRCQIGPLMTVIGADGRGWHCCVQRGQPGFSWGDLADRPFKDVWLSEAHRALMANIDVSRCPRCRYDGYNTLIEAAVQQDGLHGDFL